MTPLQESCIEFLFNPKADGFIWKDATSYSRDQKERIPTAFSTKVGGIEIYITHSHVMYKPEWIFHCRELGFDTKPIGKDLTAFEAAIKALVTCRDKAKSIYESFNL